MNIIKVDEAEYFLEILFEKMLESNDFQDFWYNMDEDRHVEFFSSLIERIREYMEEEEL